MLRACTASFDEYTKNLKKRQKKREREREREKRIVGEKQWEQYPLTGLDRATGTKERETLRDEEKEKGGWGEEKRNGNTACRNAFAVQKRLLKFWRFVSSLWMHSRSGIIVAVVTKCIVRWRAPALGPLLPPTTHPPTHVHPSFPCSFGFWRFIRGKWPSRTTPASCLFFWGPLTAKSPSFPFLSVSLSFPPPPLFFLLSFVLLFLLGRLSCEPSQPFFLHCSTARRPEENRLRMCTHTRNFVSLSLSLSLSFFLSFSGQ